MAKQTKRELTRHEGRYCTLFSFLCNSLISISSLINVLLYYSACSALGNDPKMCRILTRCLVRMSSRDWEIWKDYPVWSQPYSTSNCSLLVDCSRLTRDVTMKDPLLCLLWIIKMQMPERECFLAISTSLCSVIYVQDSFCQQCKHI